MSPRHPFLRRFSWHPVAVAIPLGYMIWSTYAKGFGVVRTIGLVWIAVWFVLSVIDLRTHHRLLDWMYQDEDCD